MIRKYKKEDLEELLDAWYSASKIAHDFLDEDFFSAEREQIASVYLPVSETWVFEREGKVVGFISLLGNEVGGLFVAAEYQRQGIGRKLLDFVRPETGQLVLDVFEENQIGRRFYEKYGFVKVGETFDEEIGRNQIRMALK